MEKLFTSLAVIFITASVWAQSPEKMSYQAVIRDSDDQLVTNQQVGMQITILQGSADGSVVYAETQTPATNANGLVSIEIGNGTIQSGDFKTINWSEGPFFIKTETDLSGGNDYSITGTSQFLSVPYALHAKTADTVAGKIHETDPVYESSTASGINANDTSKWNHKLDHYDEKQNLNDVLNQSNDGGAMQIKNIADPINSQDAATKAYVDELKAQVTLMEDMLSDAGLFPVSDVDGNSYKVINIGNRVWMAENLRVTKYNDGTDIPLAADSATWANLTTPGYCWYNNDSAAYARSYGALYNWYTINTGKLCPSGWHAATDEEWKMLELALGMSESELGNTGWHGTDEGSQLAGSKSLWMDGDLKIHLAFGSSGFEGLPAGARDDFGRSMGDGEGAWFWCATKAGTVGSWYRSLSYMNNAIYRDYHGKQLGFSVRCVRD